MEKFRYRKPDHIQYDNDAMQAQQPQTYQQQNQTRQHQSQAYRQHDFYLPGQQMQNGDQDVRLQHRQQLYNDQSQCQNLHGSRMQRQHTPDLKYQQHHAADIRQPQQQQQQQHSSDLRQQQQYVADIRHQRRYTPDLRQRQQHFADVSQRQEQHVQDQQIGDTQDQVKVKQRTNWNGVLQDLFGLDSPQTAESTHESTSSGVASDVTSICAAPPTVTTFKGGNSAGSASSAKSTKSHDSGTKSASISSSSKSDQLLQKAYLRSPVTTSAPPRPVIPKEAPPLPGKSSPHITSSSSHNGYYQISAYSVSPAAATGEGRQTKVRRPRLAEPNCVQCSNNCNNMVLKYNENNDASLNHYYCQSSDPTFCSQCCIDDSTDNKLIDLSKDARYIESYCHDLSATKDMRQLVSSPVPQLSYQYNQKVDQSTDRRHQQLDFSSRDVKSWSKQQPKHHVHEHQSPFPQPRRRQSPIDGDKNVGSTFNIHSDHNHSLSPLLHSQNRTHRANSPPVLQTFKSNNQNSASQMPCGHPANMPVNQTRFHFSEQHSENISQLRGPRMLLEHAQVHSPQPDVRKSTESRLKSPHMQLESPLNLAMSKPQHTRDISLEYNLIAGVNNLPVPSQRTNHTNRTAVMSPKGKHSLPRSAPFELLPNEVLLKIFSNLPTDHLCRCAQVCRHWYNAVWDNPILWTSIVINNQCIDIDKALKYLTRRLSYNTPKVCMILEKININLCCRLSDRGLQTVVKRCPELRYLDMQNCHLITNVGVTEAVSRCVNLERLDVTGCPLVTCISLTDSLISQSSSRHLQRIYLRYLDMTDCPNVTDEDLHTITTQCTQLLFFYLRRCSYITDLGVTYIANNCSSLRELSLSDCKNVTDLGLRELAKLRENLRYLSVAKCERVSDQGVIHVARNCSKLRYLNVRGCEAFSDAGLEYVARNCSRLRSLDIGKCDITDDGLYALSMYCPNLRKLGVKSCDAITDKGIVLIAYRCHSLQQLHVQDCCLSPDAYAMVRKYCKRAIIEHTNPAIF